MSVNVCVCMCVAVRTAGLVEAKDECVCCVFVSFSGGGPGAPIQSSRGVTGAGVCVCPCVS